MTTRASSVEVGVGGWVQESTSSCAEERRSFIAKHGRVDSEFSEAQLLPFEWSTVLSAKRLKREMTFHADGRLLGTQTIRLYYFWQRMSVRVGK